MLLGAKYRAVVTLCVPDQLTRLSSDSDDPPSSLSSRDFACAMSLRKMSEAAAPIRHAPAAAPTLRAWPYFLTLLPLLPPTSGEVKMPWRDDACASADLVAMHLRVAAVRTEISREDCVAASLPESAQRAVVKTPRAAAPLLAIVGHIMIVDYPCARDGLHGPNCIGGRSGRLTRWDLALVCARRTRIHES